MTVRKKEQKFALCVRNNACEDLELRKIYPVLSDKRAEEEGYIRVVDESGENYLYPQSYFVFVPLPRKAQAAIAAKA
jgi:hypothetical protein